jgi:2-polyprenylphenol hydroxylase and related flavodoxin oxidoreductases
MHTGNGRVLELILADGYQYLRLSCPENLIPAPGQYLLAGDGSDSPLPVPVFYTDSAPQGFIGTASKIWDPGKILSLRGPLGRGFTLPLSARKVGLVAFDDSPARLRGLIHSALAQGASVVLVCDSSSEDLPDDVEVQPLSGLDEILPWADYIAFDVSRDNLSALVKRLARWIQPQPLTPRSAVARNDVQLLVRTQIPCGSIAECGVCAVVTTSGWKMACKDGPVFDLSELPNFSTGAQDNR